jgi:hypothetical protein
MWVGVIGSRHVHISMSQDVLPVVAANELASSAVRVQLGAAGLVKEVRYRTSAGYTIVITAGRQKSSRLISATTGAGSRYPLRLGSWAAPVEHFRISL